MLQTTGCTVGGGVFVKCWRDVISQRRGVFSQTTLITAQFITPSCMSDWHEAQPQNHCRLRPQQSLLTIHGI